MEIVAVDRHSSGSRVRPSRAINAAVMVSLCEERTNCQRLRFTDSPSSLPRLFRAHASRSQNSFANEVPTRDSFFFSLKITKGAIVNVSRTLIDIRTRKVVIFYQVGFLPKYRILNQNRIR